MQTEPSLTLYDLPTIPPEPLSAADLALCTDLACYWLDHATEHEPIQTTTRLALEGKYRDVQRLRLRLMHHQVLAERQAGRVPA